MMHSDECLYCPDCSDVRMVETPQCDDGHGEDCPERACIVCGAALFYDPVTSPRRSKSGSRAA